MARLWSTGLYDCVGIIRIGRTDGACVDGVNNRIEIFEDFGIEIIEVRPRRVSKFALMEEEGGLLLYAYASGVILPAKEGIVTYLVICNSIDPCLQGRKHNSSSSRQLKNCHGGSELKIHLCMSLMG